MKEFKGFTPQTIQFFRDIAENNNKEWFDENKGVYDEEIYKPIKALVTALSPAMYNIDAGFELRPHRAVSRIYRDTRFSKNKDPYKTCMWMSFQIPVSREEWKDLPGFFMEINAESYIYGMGLFMPKKKTMDDFRDEVAFNAAEFKEMTQNTVLDKGFSLGGDEYKRPIANTLDEYYQPWIQRKGIYVFKTKPLGKEVYSSKLADVLSEDFQSLEWLYKFMKEAATL